MIARERNISYLLTCLPYVPRAIAAIQSNIPTAAAVDEVRHSLPEWLNDVLRLNVWELIRDGNLKVTEEHQETFRRRDQSEGTRQIRAERVIASIGGVKLLRPRARRTALAYQQAQSALEQIIVGRDLGTSVRKMSDADRKTTAALLSNALRRAMWATNEIIDVRELLTPMSIAKLKGWGQHPNSPVRMYIELDGRNLFVGGSAFNYRRFELPAAFFNQIRQLPDLMMYEAAE